MYRITTIDVHVAGEPLRVITGGFPELPGKTILEKRRAARAQYDDLRRALMWEPRGHADMYGCLLLPPTTPEADLGVLFLHNEGYSTMCGHGVIGLVTAVLQNGILRKAEPETLVRLDTPSGLVTARASVENGRVRSVVFTNVPSFVAALDQVVEVPGVGSVRYDLAFGGAFYVFCRAADLGVELQPAEARHLIALGTHIKDAIASSRSLHHPVEPELAYLYGTIFVGPSQTPGAHSRQACVFADGALDRSPTGTGVSARLALLHARGELEVGQPYVVESLLGTCFTGRTLERMVYAGVPAVIPEVEGCAYVTGRHEFLIDPEDPLRSGFLLR
jgi:trans-L-3-hydroxyproline dehydratase